MTPPPHPAPPSPSPHTARTAPRSSTPSGISAPHSTPPPAAALSSWARLVEHGLRPRTTAPQRPRRTAEPANSTANAKLSTILRQEPTPCPSGRRCRPSSGYPWPSSPPQPSWHSSTAEESRESPTRSSSPRRTTESRKARNEQTAKEHTSRNCGIVKNASPNGCHAAHFKENASTASFPLPPPTGCPSPPTVRPSPRTSHHQHDRLQQEGFFIIVNLNRN